MFVKFNTGYSRNTRYGAIKASEPLLSFQAKKKVDRQILCNSPFKCDRCSVPAAGRARAAKGVTASDPASMA